MPATSVGEQRPQRQPGAATSLLSRTHNGEGDLGCPPRPSVPAPPSPRNSSPPLSGQPASVSCPPPLADKEPADALPVIADVPVVPRQVTAASPPLGAESGQSSRRTQPGTQGLGRLPVQPQIVDTGTSDTVLSVPLRRSDGVLQQPVLPPLREQGPAAGGSVSGHFLPSTVSVTGQVSVLQPALESDSQASTALQHTACRPDDGTCDTGVDASAVAPAFDDRSLNLQPHSGTYLDPFGQPMAPPWWSTDISLISGQTIASLQRTL